ncbi:MAG: hypothetical protein JWQ96_2316 [Segetibacter sp.]|nr:hypothetical protein [Segetibacter sp.]
MLQKLRNLKQKKRNKIQAAATLLFFEYIETLQKLCRWLKALQEEIKWGHNLSLTIVTKMYCVTGVDGPFGTSCKCCEEDYAELV